MVEDLVVFENTTTSIIKVDANLKTDKKYNSKKEPVGERAAVC